MSTSRPRCSGARRIGSPATTGSCCGGTFANLEVVASPTPELQAAFEAAIGRPGGDPEDRLAAVEDQLTWMRAAGLEQVDCLWKWRGFALMVGQAPPT